MGIKLLDDEEIETPEAPVKIEAGSNAISPPSGFSPSVSSSIIRPVPLMPAEVAKMLEVGKERFAPYETAVNDMLREVEKINVSDEDSNKRAVEIGTQAKKLAKEIETKEKVFIKPASDFVKGIRSFVKPFTDKLDQVEMASKKKVRDYLVLKELERKKAEKALQDAHAAQQKKLDEEIEKINVQAEAEGKAKIEPMVIQPAVVRREEKTITRTESGTAHIRAGKDFKIVNLSLVPREILQAAIAKDPDKFLRPIINDEIKRNPDVEIPGILIFDSQDVIFRT